MRKLILFALAIGVILAKDTSEFTSDQRARFWRAQAEWALIRPVAERAKANVDAIRRELDEECASKKKVMVMGANGEPMCTVSK